jgi:hypothetical protein
MKYIAPLLIAIGAMISVASAQVGLKGSSNVVNLGETETVNTLRLLSKKRKSKGKGKKSKGKGKGKKSKSKGKVSSWLSVALRS